MRGFARALKQDSGVAMIAVMGVLSVVTVIAIAAFFLGQETLHESQRTSRHTAAFQLASAGMEAALADIQMNGFVQAHFQPPKHGSVLGTGGVVLGSYDVSISPEADAQYYAVSVGKASDGTSETVATKFYYLNLWDVNFGAGEGASIGGGSGWNGNATITGPLYVRGNMDWTSSANYNGGPLFIKDGRLNLQGAGQVGTVDDPIRLYATGGYAGKTGNLHASSMSYVVPDIKLPWVDVTYLDAAMAAAKDESIDNAMGTVEPAVENTECVSDDPSTYGTSLAGRSRAYATPLSTSPEYKCFADGTHASLKNGTKALTIGPKSFGAWELQHGDAAGNTVGGGYPLESHQHDDFAFDRNTGTLYIDGTVFVDGPVTFTSAVNNYVGNGAIVANGNIVIDGILIPLHGLGGGRSEALGLITPGDIRLNTQMSGAVFCNGTFGLYNTHTSYEGTVLAGVIYGDLPNITLTTNPVLKDVLPAAMPGRGGAMLTQGAWVRP